MRNILHILFFLLLTSQAFAQNCYDSKLDSLIAVYHRLDDGDTAKIKVCELIVNDCPIPDSVIMWTNRGISLAYSNADYRSISVFWGDMSWGYYYKNDYDSASICCYKGLALCDSLGDENSKAFIYYMLGGIMSTTFNYRESESFIKQALDLYEQRNDTMRIVQCLRDLATVYHNMMAYKLSDDVMHKILRLDSMANMTQELASDFCVLSEFYIERYVQSFGTEDISLILQSKDFASKSMRLKCDNLNDAFTAYIQAISAMLQEHAYFRYEGGRRKSFADSMYVFLEQADSCIQDIALDDNYFYLYLSKASCCIVAEDYKSANMILDSLSNIDDFDTEVYYKYNLAVVYRIYYILTGDFSKALYWTDIFAKVCMDEYSPADAVELTQNHAKREFEREKDLMMIAEAERATRRKAILVGIIIAFVFMAYSLYRKRQHNNILNEKNTALAIKNREIMIQNEEISQQKEEIKAQSDELVLQNEQILSNNMQITDSISYASLIQQAVLPDDELMSGLFKDYFVIFRPLHIVAGDFYWASKVARYHVLVCADCTGHGVPGAFVSMLGVSLLNEVTSNLDDNCKASEILDCLRAKLMRALKQDRDKIGAENRSNMDGMDLSMVMIDYDRMSLQYAGAYRPLCICRDNEIVQYKPDKMPIGIYMGKDRLFTNHVIDIMPGDMLYMYSDGIPDQFGYIGDDHYSCKHFSTKQLLKLLQSVAKMPTAAQKVAIENAVDAWRNGYRQLDDNILIGVRI